MLNNNTNKSFFNKTKLRKSILVVTIMLLVSSGSGTAIYFKVYGDKNDIKGQPDTVAYVNKVTSKEIITEKISNSDSTGQIDAKEVNIDEIKNSTDVVNSEDTERPSENNTDLGPKVDIPALPSILKDYETRVEDVYKKDGIKSVFLTFDDGPTKKITPQILDILKSNDVKASFFVIGNMAEKSPELLKRIYDEGHSICIHSYSHSYPIVYSSVVSFKIDLQKVNDVFHKTLGRDFSTRIYRFPGGSYESKQEPNKKQPFKEFLTQTGYQYIDWNTLTGDAEIIKDETGKKRTRNAEELVSNLKSNMKRLGKREDFVILMHDAATKQNTVNSLQEIIDYLKEEGFVFKTIK